MEKKKVVIIGGGFGGIYVAKGLKKLAKKGLIDVTILDRNNHFLFTPLLHEVATGGLSPSSITESIREIFKKTPINFIQTEVLEIDAKNQRVIVSNKKDGVGYDFLVISTGATTKFLGIPGAKEHSLSLKNLSDALKIRSRIIDSFEKASIETDPDKRKQLLNFVVVGGGATGVELVSELSEFILDTLCPFYKNTFCKKVEVNILMVSSSEILPIFPKKIKSWAYRILEKKGIEIMKNKKVSEVSEDRVRLSDGQEIISSNIFWTAGVVPQVPSFTPNILTDKGKIKVNEFLSVVGFKNIFALGDSSSFRQDGEELRMFAQIAVQQAKNVSKNISLLLKKESTKPFRYKSKGYLISVGQWMALGDILGIEVKGKFVWWIWRTVYLFKFSSIRKRLRIAFEWTINLFYSRDITKIN